MVLLTAMRGVAYDFESAGICYQITASDEVSVVAGDQLYTGCIVVPAQVENGSQTYQVTAVGDNAFRNCATLVSVSLPESVSRIGASAFSNCPHLCSIVLPAAVTTIDDAAFYGCSSLFKINIPAAVTTIGDEAFVRCTGLGLFDVAADNANYSAVGGVLMNKQQTTLISYPNLHADYYTVPTGVTEIASWAFLGCSRLRSVTLPSGLLTIGNAAFHGCPVLQSVTWPSSLQSIGIWAFSECPLLEEVSLGDNVAEIGEGAFSFCPQVQTIRVSASNSHYTAADGVLLTKDQRTLVACPSGKTGSYRILETVEAIGSQAFYGCNLLESVTLTPALSELGDNPFVFCDNLNEILVSGDHPGLSSNGGVLLNKEQSSIVFFPNAKRGAYTVPAGVTDLQCGPFMRSRLLTNLTIPQGVSSIGNWAFMDCEGLQTVSLPSTLTSLGERAFDCPSLKTVIFGGQPLQTTAFSAADYSRTTLYMPKGSENDFLQTEGWGVFGTYKPFGLYVQDQSLPAGNTAAIPIYTTGPLHVTQAEADIVLPEVLKPQHLGDGSYVVELAEQVTGTVTCEKKEGNTYHITLQCDDKRVLAGDADVLFSLAVDCMDVVGESVYDMSLQAANFSYAGSIHTGSALQPLQVVTVRLSSGTGGGIQMTTADRSEKDVYNLQGQLVRRAGEKLHGLTPGVYVVDGKKILLSR